MKIRQAVIEDQSQVMLLFDELRNFIAGEDKLISPEHRKRSETVFEEVISRTDTTIFVAEEEGTLLRLAFFCLTPNIKHGHYRGSLEDLMVVDSMRGKGIGTKLINHIKNYCKTNNITVFKLHSGLELTKAHQFYEKNGGKFTEKMFRFDIS